MITAKVPTTPRNQARGVVAALEIVQPAVGAVASFAHGSTVATNALLERRGARTALVTTQGFRDVIEIGRQNRPALYDLTRDRPAALVPRALRFTVRERMGPDGVLVPLDEESVRAAVDACREAGVEAVAVCLLFGFLHPEHEQQVGEALREALPGVQISLSSEVLPEFREYERCSTTVCNSYLAPRLGAYLERLADEVEALGLPSPLVMQSSGGAADISTAAAHAVSCLLSGPAGGVVGAAWVAGLSGFQDLLTFDMGGTSTDVAPVLGRCGADHDRVGRGRGAGQAADGGCAYGQRRRRLHRLGRRRRRPARRAQLGWSGPRPGCLWPRRRGANGHGREPVSRVPARRRQARRRGPARSRPSRERRSVASAISSAWTARRPHAGSSRWPTPR